MRTGVLIVLLALSCCSTGAQILGIDIYEFMRGAETITLISLDPTHPQSLPQDEPGAATEKIQGYRILGRVDATDPREREQIRQAVIEAFTDFAEGSHECFEPRHAIRLIYRGRCLDILMSYQCLESRFHLEGQSNLAPLGPRGEESMNAVLDAHGIKRDTPKKKTEPNQSLQPTPIPPGEFGKSSST